MKFKIEETKTTMFTMVHGVKVPVITDWTDRRFNTSAEAADYIASNMSATTIEQHGIRIREVTNAD